MKKNMKTNLTVLLCTLAAAASLTACNIAGNDDSVIEELPEKTEAAQLENNTDDDTEDETDVDDEDETDVDAEDDNDADAEGEDDGEVSQSYTDKYVLGSYDGNTYTNDYFGIAITIDDDWTYNSKEQILAANQMASELVSDDFSDVFSSTNVFIDMLANNANQMDVTQVTIEKLQGMATVITEDKYVELSKDQVIASLESMGLENVVGSVSERELAGEVHPSLVAEGEYMGVPFYQEQVIIKGYNGYIMSVSVCTWQENKIDEAFDMYYKVDDIIDSLEDLGAEE